MTMYVLLQICIPIIMGASVGMHDQIVPPVGIIQEVKERNTTCQTKSLCLIHNCIIAMRSCFYFCFRDPGYSDAFLESVLRVNMTSTTASLRLGKVRG